MISNLIEKIRSRGYWEIIIRPTKFSKAAINDITRLFPLIEKTAVQIRGWDFPHVDIHNQPVYGGDWVQQEIEWEHHLASWRFYQSGLFIQTSGFWVDWRDQSNFWPADSGWQPQTRLGVADSLFVFREVFEFAARLSLSEAGGDSIFISLKACNINGRKLYIDEDPTFELFQQYPASISEYPYTKEIAKSDLVATLEEQGILGAAELFKRFGWNPNLTTLNGLMNHILRR